MSFGGSIIYNTLKTLSITPIAPLNNKAYNSLLIPVIVPDNKVISMITRKDCNDLFLMIDGVNKEIDKVKEIETKIGKKTIKCLRMNSYHFVKIVHDKLLEK
jgi:NAD+ kinase